MSRAVQPITAQQLTQIEAAVSRLREARGLLRDAGANRAADYVARALKSAEGAQRHAERRAQESVYA